MMFSHCKLVSLVLACAVAQDLFEKDTTFLAPRVSTMQATGTNFTAHARTSDDSWYKTITPEENHMLCLDAPGGNAFNGNMLWLWECSGKDSQIWVFDNYQIKYGADEGYCIDARDMSNGEQLMLWECNGEGQQTWGYDADALRVYVSGSSTCFDLWEDQQWNGQPLHIWECNGHGGQQWDLWPSDAPSGPSPGPAPGPSGNTWPPHCADDNPGGWPVFNSPDDLQNDPWGNYFQQVYGGIPQSGYPICISSFHFLVDYAVANAGLGLSPSSNCPAQAGDYFKTMAPDGIQSPGASWIWNPNGFNALPSNVWVEGAHKAFYADIGSAWMYYAPGSAIWFWLGNTAVYEDHRDAVKDILHQMCFDKQCMNQFTALFSKAAQDGYDSVQFLGHYDQTCGKSPWGSIEDKLESPSRYGVGAPGNKCGAIEIVDTKGTGKQACASNYRTGWEASQDCNCDGSKDYANCVGFGDQS